MKQKKHSIIIILLLIFAGNNALVAQSHTLNGLSELQAFTATTGTETVQDLTIIEIAGTAIPEAEIFKVANRVGKITGTLTLQGLTALTTTIGLIDKINCADAGFVFKDCPNLVDMDAFSTKNLTVINGDFIIENCPKVATGGATAYLDKSFSNIKEVKGDFKLIGITAAISKQEKILPKLERVEGDFVIQGCTRIYYFTNSDNSADMPLKYIGGDLILKNNAALQRLNGFGTLKHIGGDVIILDNSGIPNGATDDTTIGFCKIRYYQMAGIIKNDADVQVGKTGTLVDLSKITPCPYELAEDIDGTFTAVPANKFLSSIGVNTSINRRFEYLSNTQECMEYIGARWIRASIVANPHGATEIPETSTPGTANSIADYKHLYENAGIRFSFGLGAGGRDTNIPVYISSVKRLIEATDPNIIIALEGNNEPNHSAWYIVFEDEIGGGSGSGKTNWKPVARMQKKFYEDVKADPVLKNYPVWDLSYGGAGQDNVGLQYLKVPDNEPNVPAEFHGVTFADVANLHNYFDHPSFPAPQNNQTWRAAEPSSNVPPGVDVLYRHYGKTWAGGYLGYADEELVKLPRVTTETGMTIRDNITEELQGLMYLSLYLSQYKRGFEHTAMYILRDRVDESGNQSFGFYNGNYKPRLSAQYLHNMTTILADKKDIATPGQLTYSITGRTVNIHDLLLQKEDGTFELVVWSERFRGGSDKITVGFDKKYDEIWVYDPTKGKNPVKILKNVDSFELEMTNHPYIIEIGNHPPLGIEEVSKKSTQVRMFPNPVVNDLFVYSDEDMEEITLHDSLGKCLYRISGQKRDAQLDMSSLPKGMYILHITDTNNQVIAKRKIIK